MSSKIAMLLLYSVFIFLRKVDFAESDANSSEETVTEIVDTSQDGAEMDEENATSSFPTVPSSIRPDTIIAVPDSSRFFCKCDLTASVCDINCCCDPECSEHDRRSFSFCLGGPLVPKSRRCFRKTWFFHEGSEELLRSTEVSQDNFFCLVSDNLKQKHFFENSPVLDSETDFQGLERFSWSQSSSSVQQALSRPTKSGDTIWIILESDKQQAVPWTFPGSFFSSFCDAEIPVLYLSDLSSSCLLPAQRVHLDCGTAQLSSRYYHSGFKLLRKSAELVTTKQDSICDKEKNACLTIQPTTDAIPADSILTPDGQCLHAVKKVKYRVEHFGVDGIWAVHVSVVTATVNISDPLLQMFEVQFEWANQTAVATKRSGNPGYQTGLPILAQSANRSSVESLTVFGVQTDGSCTEIDQERTVVAFKHNLMTGCSLTVALPTNRSCHFLRCLTRDQLLGSYLPEYVLSYGLRESDPVQIFSVGDEVTSILDPVHSCANIPGHMDLTIAYAATHTVEDPQMKIVGVRRDVRQVQVPLRCFPSNDRCQVYLASLTLTASVTFSKTGPSPYRKFGGPPRLGGNLPMDFFYPFLTTQSFACDPGPLKIWLLFLNVVIVRVLS